VLLTEPIAASQAQMMEQALQHHETDAHLAAARRELDAMVCRRPWSAKFRSDGETHVRVQRTEISRVKEAASAADARATRSDARVSAVERELAGRNDDIGALRAELAQKARSSVCVRRARVLSVRGIRPTSSRGTRWQGEHRPVRPSRCFRS
jgi:hypothetical protein